jgi:hypothetical protein
VPATFRLAAVFFLIVVLLTFAGPVRPLSMSVQGWWLFTQRLGYGRLAMALVAAGLVAAAAFDVPVDPRIAYGTTLIGIGWGLVSASTRTDANSTVPPDQEGFVPPMVARSLTQLQKIRYQQTVTRGWSEALKLGALGQSPLSVERTTTGGETLARVPLTYPEIVAEFHEYTGDLVRDGKSVVIGIDELDKLDPDAAFRFMNDVKAIFDGHVPGCYYLVSVSEEALAGFEQRGLPTRDVFDTAFDEMLRVDYLTIDETVVMLSTRLIDLPRGVAQLCHALAGGLPRDVIRTLRMVIAAREAHGTTRLAELAALVCGQELASRLNAMRTELRHCREWVESVEIAKWADALALTDVATAETLPVTIPGSTLDLLRLHTCSYYHLSTVSQFFEKASGDDLEIAERAGTDSSIEMLARARQAMGASWALSWDDVSAFRQAWGLATLAQPT